MATFACALSTLRVFMPWTTEAMETGAHFATGFVPFEAQKHQSERKLEGLHVDRKYLMDILSEKVPE